MTICILGSGSFGSALAIALAKHSPEVILWSRSQESANSLQLNRKNKKYLANENFPENVKVTSDLKLAVTSASKIIICIPAQKIYTFLSKNYSKITRVPIILCSKGIDEKTSLLQSQIITKFLPQNEIAILTGPSFANEVAAGLPTALTLACENNLIRDYLQKSLSTPNLRLYSSSDIIGAQLGGSLKNVIAIGCGMVKGTNLGESARIALMTRGLSEIINLGLAMGANLNTFYGLSGLGDLALTCNSMQSRNLIFGLNYCKNLTVESNNTVEGIKTASAVTKIAKKLNVTMPIVQTIDLILKDKVSLDSSITDLLSRPLKREFIQ